MCSRCAGYVLVCIIRRSLSHVDNLEGNLKSLNDLAKQARADYIVHTGDFGFYDESSLDRIADKYVSSRLHGHLHIVLNKSLIGLAGL